MIPLTGTSEFQEVDLDLEISAKCLLKDFNAIKRKPAHTDFFVVCLIGCFLLTLRVLFRFIK